MWGCRFTRWKIWPDETNTATIALHVWGLLSLLLNKGTCWRHWNELHLQIKLILKTWIWCLYKIWLSEPRGIFSHDLPKLNHYPHQSCHTHFIAGCLYFLSSVLETILVTIPTEWSGMFFGAPRCQKQQVFKRLQGPPSKNLSKLTWYKMPVIYYDHMTSERCYHNTVIWMHYYFCRIPTVQGQQVSKSHFFHHLKL